MKKNVYYLLILILLLNSCRGVKFDPAPINADLPNDLKHRTVIDGLYSYSFEDYVGQIFVLENKEIRRTKHKIVLETYEIKPIPILEEDSHNFYKSRITKGAKFKANYLAFAADFTGEEMAEITLVDFARAEIKFTKSVQDDLIPKMEQWVANNPKPAGMQRLWVQAAVLTKKFYSGYTKIDANAQAQVGEVVGVEAGVYRKEEIQGISVILGFYVLDIDDYVKEFKSTETVALKSTSSHEDIIEKVRYVGVLKGNIND